MPVTDLEVFMLRAHIADEDEEAQRAFSRQAATSDDISGLAWLVHAASAIATRRQFAPTSPRSGHPPLMKGTGRRSPA